MILTVPGKHIIILTAAGMQANAEKFIDGFPREKFRGL